MKSQYEWVLLATLASEHRLFRDAVSTKLAIADKSGSTPSQTEDGVLWINMGDAARVGYEQTIGGYVAVSVRGPRVSAGSKVLVDLEDIELLTQHGVKVVVGMNARKQVALWEAVAKLMGQDFGLPPLKTIVPGPDTLETVRQHLERCRAKDHGPRQVHDCESCCFLRSGDVQGKRCDWWLCPTSPGSSNGGSLIARWGSEGNYTSFPLATILTWNERPDGNFGGTDPNGFVQLGRVLLAELGYRMQGDEVVLDTREA